MEFDQPSSEFEYLAAKPGATSSSLAASRAEDQRLSYSPVEMPGVIAC